MIGLSASPWRADLLLDRRQRGCLLALGVLLGLDEQAQPDSALVGLQDDALLVLTRAVHPGFLRPYAYSGVMKCNASSHWWPYPWVLTGPNGTGRIARFTYQWSQL